MIVSNAFYPFSPFLIAQPKVGEGRTLTSSISSPMVWRLAMNFWRHRLNFCRFLSPLKPKENKNEVLLQNCIYLGLGSVFSFICLVKCHVQIFVSAIQRFFPVLLSLVIHVQFGLGLDSMQFARLVPRTLLESDDGKNIFQELTQTNRFLST